jgi:regulation of enolase protein 1 (concanavalin A-like superfamily)
MIREVHAFAKGENEGKVFIGIMACSPLGGGSEARFSGLEYKYGVREVV